MRILLAMPRVGAMAAMEAAQAFYHPTAHDSKLQVRCISPSSSGTTGNFNSLWCMARNEWEAGRCDAFAMIHHDVGARVGWLDTLHEELTRLNVDVVSVPIPIKDEYGVTSTAIDRGDPWRVSHRITMKELHDLPETFTDEDVGEQLLMGTGLWLAKLGPWVNECHFRDMHHFARDEKGKWEYRVMSEDWDFARQLRQLGLVVAHTRKVTVNHHGDWRWCNQNIWGRETEAPGPELEPALVAG